MPTGAGRSGLAGPAAARVALAGLLLAWSVGGEGLPPDLDGLVAARAEAAIALRHDLHRHPELSNREVETGRRLASELRTLGLEVEGGVAKTGVVARLVGGRPGPVVAVRADIDALPVTEATDLPFRSEARAELDGREVGVAHACGHDIHTAVAMGTAAVLTAWADDLPGTVVFLFQPAEEGPPPGEEGGAKLMVAEGVLDRFQPIAVLGLHSWPSLVVGEVAVTEGAAMAAVDRFRVEVAGRQAHGAAPHLGADPVVAAAELVLAFQTIPSRSIDPLAPSVLTVGVIRGGERYNIIPGQVELAGTVRTFDESVRTRVETRMREIARGVGEVAGVEVTLDYERITPAMVNDADLSRRLVPRLEAVLGEERVSTGPPVMIGEDFAFFAREVPGYYVRLGTTAADGRSGGLHTPTFRGDDGAIPVGMRAMIAMVLAVLDTGPRS